MIIVIKISIVSSIKQKEGTIVRLKRSLPIYIYAQERCSYKLWYGMRGRFHLKCFSYIKIYFACMHCIYLLLLSPSLFIFVSCRLHFKF